MPMLRSLPAATLLLLCLPAAAAAAQGPNVPKPPADGGPRDWIVTGVMYTLNLRQGPSIAAPVAARLRPGTILDNLGCRRTGRRVWCDVRPLGGGPRGYVSAAFLRPARAPDGHVPTGPDDSARRAGRGRFDASGEIPCAPAAGQAMGRCRFGVARAGGGYATVVVRRPDGRSRAIHFRLGRAVGADGGDPPFRARRARGLHRIRIGGERYEIPDALVQGPPSRRPPASP